MTDLEEIIAEIEKLTTNMAVPEQRRRDIGWLKRNLAINNKPHNDFDRVVALLDSYDSCREHHMKFDGNPSIFE